MTAVASTASADEAWTTSTQLPNSTGVGARRVAAIIALLESADLVLRRGTRLRLKRRA